MEKQVDFSLVRLILILFWSEFLQLHQLANTFICKSLSNYSDLEWFLFHKAYVQLQKERLKHPRISSSPMFHNLWCNIFLQFQHDEMLWEPLYHHFNQSKLFYNIWYFQGILCYYLLIKNMSKVCNDEVDLIFYFQEIFPVLFYSLNPKFYLQQNKLWFLGTSLPNVKQQCLRLIFHMNLFIL